MIFKGGGRICAVPQCRNSARKTLISSNSKGKITYHNFPASSPLLREWVDKINFGKPPSKCSQICSEHFTAEDFQKYASSTCNERFLKNTAVPTLNLPIRSFETVSQERQPPRRTSSPLQNDLGVFTPASGSHVCKDEKDSIKPSHDPAVLEEFSSFPENIQPLILPTAEVMVETTEEIKVEHQLVESADAFYHDPLSTVFAEPISGEETRFELGPGSILESVVNIKIEPEENYTNPEPEITHKANNAALYVNGWIKQEETDISEVDCDNASVAEVFDKMLKEVPSTLNQHPDKIEERAETEPFSCASCQACFTDIVTFTTHITESCFKHLYQRHVSASPPAAMARPKKHQSKVCKKSIPCASPQSSRRAPRLGSNNIKQKSEALIKKNTCSCDICGRSFARKHNRDQHMLIHSAEMKRKCEVSVEEFRGTGEDTRIKTNVQDFTCAECGKRFARLIYLKKHLARHASVINSEGNKHLKFHNNEKKFACNICSRTFSRKDNRDQHMFVHESKTNHRCDICDTGSRCRFALHHHRLKQRVLNKFPCNICGRTFARKYNRTLHTFVHESKTDHRCDICDKGSLCRFALHQQKLNAKAFECGDCGKRFGMLSNLKQHLVIHTGVRNFACHFCHKSFAVQKERRRHMVVHGGKKEHKCEVCDRVFLRVSDLRSHMRSHNRAKNYECANCERRFATLAYLKRHQLEHSGEKNFACNFCSKTFAFDSHRNNHMVVVHTGEKNFACEICNKAFGLKGQLASHMKVHGAKEHKCDICPKMFRTPREVRSHMHVHADVKNEECAECGKKYGSVFTLKRHLRVHFGKKNFACSVCNKLFVQKGKRDSHMSVHETGVK